MGIITRPHPRGCGEVPGAWKALPGVVDDGSISSTAAWTWMTRAALPSREPGWPFMPRTSFGGPCCREGVIPIAYLPPQSSLSRVGYSCLFRVQGAGRLQERWSSLVLAPGSGCVSPEGHGRARRCSCSTGTRIGEMLSWGWREASRRRWLRKRKQVSHLHSGRIREGCSRNIQAVSTGPSLWLLSVHREG